jgi:serine phosphatase RsbU (regulator of sigma subunit)
MNKESEEFSDERLEENSIKLSSFSAEEILDGIKNKVTDFTQGASQSDDITMVVIKVK